jgi:hypothetical protein
MYKVIVGNSNGKWPLGKATINGRFILKFIFKNQNEGT